VDVDGEEAKVYPKVTFGGVALEVGSSFRVQRSSDT
jgi:hypothetical protein